MSGIRPGVSEGIRPAQYRRSVPVAPGSISRLNGMPVRFYRYQGTGEDTLTAWMDDEPEEEVPRLMGRPVTAPCGTAAAYRRHTRHGEEPCWECKEARRRADRERLNGSDSTFNSRRRERYREAREAGMTPREANGHRWAS